MRKKIICTSALIVICMMGGHLEHGTPGGAWLVIWLVPVVCAAVQRGLHREAVDKTYRQVAANADADRKRFLGEMAIRRCRIKKAPDEQALNQGARTINQLKTTSKRT